MEVEEAESEASVEVEQGVMRAWVGVRMVM